MTVFAFERDIAHFSAINVSSLIFFVVDFVCHTIQTKTRRLVKNDANFSGCNIIFLQRTSRLFRSLPYPQRYLFLFRPKVFLRAYSRLSLLQT